MRGIPEDKIKAWIKDVNGRCLDDTWWIESELLKYIEELQETWIPLEEFLRSEFEGLCWVFTEDSKVILLESIGDGFFDIADHFRMHHKIITHVIPIHKPEPPI